MIFCERDVFFIVPVHCDDDMIKLLRVFDLVDGLENLIRIGDGKRSSFTEVVLRVNNYQCFSHFDFLFDNYFLLRHFCELSDIY